MNPPENEPVVILPKNKPDIHDCIRIAMPNSWNLDFESASNITCLYSSVSSWAPKPVRESIVHHSIDGTFSIRKGEWKLILGKDSGGFSKSLKVKGIPVSTEGQLYRLTSDPTEQHNLYDQKPEIVMELSTLLNKYKNQGYSN